MLSYLLSHKQQDFSQALVWESNMLYTLRREPALIAIGTRHGDLAFEWPKRSFPIYRWFRPRAIDLPKGARLVGPVLCGDRVVLRSQVWRYFGFLLWPLRALL